MRCSEPPSPWAVGRFGKICSRLLQPTGRFRRRSAELSRYRRVTASAAQPPKKPRYPEMLFIPPAHDFVHQSRASQPRNPLRNSPSLPRFQKIG